jgi:hypothetical protein
VFQSIWKDQTRMSRNDKDKLADALHALTGGDGQETDETVIEETNIVHEAEAVAPEPTPAPVAPPPPAAVPAARPTRPSAPGVSAVRKSAAPSTTTAPTTSTAPARPSRPAAPAPSATPAAVDYARKPVRKVVKKSKYNAGSLLFRQTLIPPCLVAGGMFVLLAIAFFLQPSTYALRQASLYFPIGIGVMGAVVLAMGIFNMILVKKELERKGKSS